MNNQRSLLSHLILWLFCCAGLASGCGSSSNATFEPQAQQPSTQPPSWSWLGGTRWAIPASDLTAYYLPTGASEPIALKQQVLIEFASSQGGYLQGQAFVQLSDSTALAQLGTDEVETSLVGSITPEGQLDLLLTTPSGTQVRVGGPMIGEDGGWRMQLQSAAGQSPRLIQQAGFRQLVQGEAPASLGAESPPPGADPWSWLPGTTWYVPIEGLLAYILGPSGTPPIPIGDQTIYQVSGYDRGYFWGPTQATLSEPSGVSGYGQAPLPMTMLGCVSPEGAILLSFGPQDGSSPPTTGYGAMRWIDGEYAMVNQTTTSSTPMVLHWAPMKQLRPGQTPPDPALVPRPATAATDPWAVLANTSWYVPQENLPALRSTPGGGAEPILDQTTYTIDRYVGGYIFGEGAVQLGQAQPFSVSLAGSVTPDGQLYLLFRDQQDVTTLGLGRMTTYNGQLSMENQMTSGHAQLITHWAYMLRPRP